MSNLNSKVITATKWSTVTEIIAKLITPITNIILARILTPEAFGVVATLTMVISFFQKYLIQHEFKDRFDLEQSTNVAFWSNLILSLFIWLIIGIFSESIAVLVGNPGLGYVLTIACVSIPLASFSSIQMALYKRNLDFKTLFKVRIVGICIPLVVTVPLALYFRNFWALVIGTIASNIVNAILLTAYSRWKPKFYYSLTKFREMFSFTSWSMIEAISIWLTGYVDVFIIGVYLNEHYLGLYKTSITVVGQIMGLITSATTPILFSALSRLQNDEEAFRNLFLKFQRLLGIFIIPMGVGIYCFSDLVTKILLGDQWREASGFIGLWGLTSALTIVFSHYSSEVYRAKGRPKLSVLAQVLHIIVLWPAVLVAVKYGFEILYTVRALVRVEGILVNLVIMYLIMNISPIGMFKNVFVSCFSAMGMSVVACMLSLYRNSILWDLLSVLICVIIYCIIIFCFRKEREELKSLMLKLRINK